MAIGFHKDTQRSVRVSPRLGKFDQSIVAEETKSPVIATALSDQTFHLSIMSFTNDKFTDFSVWTTSKKFWKYVAITGQIAKTAKSDFSNTK